MDPLSKNNLTNNPRVDLLHSSGDNQHLAGPTIAASTSPALPLPGQPTAPTPQSASPSEFEDDKPQSKRFDLLHGRDATQDSTPSEGADHPKSPLSLRAQPQTSVAPKSAAALAEKTPPKAPEASAPASKPAAVPEPRSARALPAQQPARAGRSRAMTAGLLVVVVIAAAGAGGYYFLTHHQASQTAATPATTASPSASATPISPITPTALSQEAAGNSLAAGRATNQANLSFNFTAQTSATSGSLTPEVEVEPVGTAFTGQPTYTGSAVSANGGSLEFAVTASGLKDGAYHWQARDSAGGKSSNWTIFGSDATALAFSVETVAPGAPTVSMIGGVKVTNPTLVTSNQPAISGTTAPGASVKITVTPGSQTFNATADSSGNWSITPNAAIPNGQYSLSVVATDVAGNTSTPAQVALAINPASVAQTLPVAGAGGATAKVTTPAGSSSLAQTGDNTDAVSAASLLVMLMAGASLIWMRRRYAAR